jgi:hypothetical protein
MDQDHGQARHTDPATSHAAAASISPGKMRTMLLQAFAVGGPMTDESAALLAGLEGTEYASRCSELRRDGLLLVAQGVTRPGTSGRARMVSACSHEGAAAAGLPGVLVVAAFPGSADQTRENMDTHTWRLPHDGGPAFCECGARAGGTLGCWPCGWPVAVTVQVLL